MSWKASELDALLTQDVDDVVARGRSLLGKDRTAAMRYLIARLEDCPDPLDHLKILLFVQTLLAFIPDGMLSPTLADRGASVLGRIVASPSYSEEHKRSALTALSLLRLKAKKLTTVADAHLRVAFQAATDSPDPEISGFAQRAIQRNGTFGQTPLVQGAQRRRHLKAAEHMHPKVLVIHGRNTKDLGKLDEIIRRLQITPVIFRNLPARGRTIIEKFEQEAGHATYAIALLTPDDFVDSPNENYRQARPNVTFELGWLFGKLGRARVSIILKRGTELPSDLAGINRLDFEKDVLDAFSELQKELESAGVLPRSVSRVKTA